MDKKAKIQKAEEKAGQWLAKANELSEKGKKVAAEKAYGKSTYWLGVANKLRGW